MVLSVPKVRVCSYKEAFSVNTMLCVVSRTEVSGVIMCHVQVSLTAYVTRSGLHTGLLVCF